MKGALCVPSTWAHLPLKGLRQLCFHKAHIEMTAASRGDQDKGQGKKKKKSLKKDSNPCRLPRALLGMLEKCTIREAGGKAEVVGGWRAACAGQDLAWHAAKGLQRQLCSGSICAQHVNSLRRSSGSNCRPGHRGRSEGCSGNDFTVALRGGCWKLL